MNTWTCGSRYRDFDIMRQHQQLIFFLYIYIYVIDWNVAFNRMFNLLNQLSTFDNMLCHIQRPGF